MAHLFLHSKMEKIRLGLRKEALFLLSRRSLLFSQESGTNACSARFSARLTLSYCLQVKCSIFGCESTSYKYSKSPLSTG